MALVRNELSVFRLSVIMLISPQFLASDTCSSKGCSSQPASVLKADKNNRYLLYAVSDREGFNGRVDLHFKMAVLVDLLNKSEKGGRTWILVLPPFTNIPHWKRKSTVGESYWRNFFDVNQLNKYVPTIELDTYIRITRNAPVAKIFKGYPYTGFKDYIRETGCPDDVEWHGYYQSDSGLWRGPFWGHEMSGRSFTCLHTAGGIRQFVKFFRSLAVKSILIDGIMGFSHVSPDTLPFWLSRRSLKFSDRLIAIGNQYRKEQLNSTDELDKTPSDRAMRREVGSAVGANFLSAHLRRSDYLAAYGEQLPSLKSAAAQIIGLAEEFKLDLVFLCTDASPSEIQRLEKELKAKKLKLVSFNGDESEGLTEGQLAITQMWIAAHARIFIGTTPSTFSKRIMEERFIMGFNQEQTSRVFCSDTDEPPCYHVWKYTIVYDGEYIVT